MVHRHVRSRGQAHRQSVTGNRPTSAFHPLRTLQARFCILQSCLSACGQNLPGC